ncbi:phosphatase PAP2 family protein [Radiobacillus deserti]|nr:phosphatase PAP2 family protein [Radiobacillus deserti]
MKKETIWIVLASTIALLISSILTFRIVNGGIPLMDRLSAPLVKNLEGNIFFLVFRWITELGSGTFLTPFSIIMAILIAMYYKQFLAGFFIFTGTLLGYRMNHWIKVLVQRERPRILEAAEGQGYSFPSGHAMVSLIGYGLIIYFLYRYLKNTTTKQWIFWSGIILIFLIGMSRFVIRVHYLSDVLAGFAFGFLFLISWIGLYLLISYLQDRLFRISKT